MKQYKLVNSRTKEETFCSKIVIDKFDYYINDYISDEVNGDLTKIPFNKIILLSVATTNPNIDVPKVIDEIKELSIKEYGPIGIGLERALCFKNGYNKSQETHPYSDEDIIKFNTWQHDLLFSENSDWLIEKSIKELLQIWKKQKIKTIYYED